jgi:imidazolonepropionase-like amidohydrolase
VNRDEEPTMKSLPLLIGLLICFCAFSRAVGAQTAPPQERLVFEHVTVIDVATGSALADRSVVIADRRISAVKRSSDGGIPNGAKVIDATGKFLIPGLWDMHVHFLAKPNGTLFVANGVTGVRVMWGNPKGDATGSVSLPHTQWRQEFADGKAVGPRMVIASELVDGPNPIWPGSVVVRNAAEGREAVRAAKKAAADFVKVYELIPPDAYFAIAEECKALGIPFAGHVPQLITAAQASDAGQSTFEHLYGIREACSTRQDEVMQKRAEALRNSKGLETIRAVGKAQREMIRASFSESKAQSLFAQLKKNGTWQCPTLTVLRSISQLDDAKFTDDPRLKYLPGWVRVFWDPKNDFRFKTTTAADFALMKKNFQDDVHLVLAMKNAGVGILAGTDEANPYCFPGFSLHDELALLVKAGLSPAEALQTATINPARFLGKQRTQGSIEEGKDADLVLLDGNPIVDIHNTTAIRAVVASGRLFDRAGIDQILTDAERASREKPQDDPKTKS